MDKLKQDSKKERHIVNIGVSLMIVVLIGLSFAVITALALSSAKNNLDLTTKLSEHTKEYYQACSLAYEEIDKVGWQNQSFTVPINDKQELYVEVEDGEIVCMREESTGGWNFDDTLPVHIIE